MSTIEQEENALPILLFPQQISFSYLVQKSNNHHDNWRNSVGKRGYANTSSVGMGYDGISCIISYDQISHINCAYEKAQMNTEMNDFIVQFFIKESGN